MCEKTLDKSIKIQLPSVEEIQTTMSDFQLLITDDVLAKYKYVEIIHFFFRINKKIHNLFTTFNFLEELKNEEVDYYSKDDKLTIKKVGFVGYKKVYIDKNLFESKFKELISKGVFEYNQKNEKNEKNVDNRIMIQIDDYKLINKKFVATKESKVYPTIKNLNHDFYFFEIFNLLKMDYTEAILGKNILSLTEDVLNNIDVDESLKEINKWISNNENLKNCRVNITSDRIGNVIIKLPIYKQFVEMYKNKEFILKIKSHVNEQYMLNINKIYKEGIEVICSEILDPDYEESIFLEDIEDCNVEGYVYDIKNKIIVKKYEVDKYYSTGCAWGESNIRNVNGNEVILKSDITNNVYDRANYIIKARESIDELTKLQKRNSYFEYSGDSKSDQKPIDDIIAIINSTGNLKSIKLMDPYLKSKDIIKTVYKTENRNVPIKCLSVYSKAKEKGLYVDEFISNEKSELDEVDCTGLNLEYKTLYDSNFEMHDRFLILETYFYGTNVWAIGASLNNICCNHSIIYKLAYGGGISTLFDTIWEKEPSKLVYKKTGDLCHLNKLIEDNEIVKAKYLIIEIEKTIHHFNNSQLNEYIRITSHPQVQKFYNEIKHNKLN